jgi:hypothetical protein
LNREQLIGTFTKTGEFLSVHSSRYLSSDHEHAENERLLHLQLEEIIQTEHQRNGWFTEENIRLGIQAIAEMLKKEHLEKWIGMYPGLTGKSSTPITVGVVMAGNIPLVGFHDLLSVLLAGHRFIGKTSSRDDRLVKHVAAIIQHFDPTTGSGISFTDGHLKGMNAVIATGSNNSARYFEYYFRDVPHLIRKNRNGIAILTGKESRKELQALGKDIFTYFGLGCRNVTKLYVPEGFDLTRLMEVFEGFLHLAMHNKYANNIDYYRSIYLMNREPFLDNGALLLRESADISSPVGVAYYENYSELDSLMDHLESKAEEIQCMVSREGQIPGTIAFGSTQYPALWDYADGVDTVKFLMSTGA